MALNVKCPNPNCTHSQTVIEDGDGRWKRKKCRKCGTPMVSPLSKSPKSEPKTTVEELAKMYPNQVAEIVSVAKADVAADEFGGLKADEVENAFPDAVVEIINKATAEFKDLKPDELKNVFPDAAKKLITAAKKDGQNSILKLSINKIAKIQEKQKAKPKKG